MESKLALAVGTLYRLIHLYAKLHIFKIEDLFKYEIAKMIFNWKEIEHLALFPIFL